MRGRFGTRLATALLVALTATLTAALLLPAAPALAHAVLLRSDPADGAVLALPPSAVRLVFNGPVDGVGAGLRVFAADGTRVDLGRTPTRADVDGDDRSTLAVSLPENLPDGGYVATWRVLSADGHAVAGSLRFTVGDAAPVSEDVAAALANADAPLWLRSADRAVRGGLLIGLLVASGAAAAAVAVAHTPAQRRGAARVILVVSLVTLALVPLGLWLQAAVITGAAGTAGTTETVGSGAGSGVAGWWVATSSTLHDGGQLPAAAVRTVGLVALAAISWRGRLPGLLVLPAAALALLPLASEGHQRSPSGPGAGGSGALWAALLPGLDGVHVAAGALWVGAVLLLALTVRRPGTSEAGAGDEAAALAKRVGRTALLALGVVSLSGAGQAALLIDTPESLVTTAYGTTLLMKVAVVAAAVITASLARRRASRAGGWQAARRLLQVELALLGVAALVTGVLVTLPPPVDARADLFTSSAPLGDGLLLDVGLDGSRPGRTELHVYVLEDGALTARDLDVQATLTSVPDGIGPFRVAPLRVEPGHWFAALEPLPPGEWSLEITVGVDRFTERTTTFTVPLR